MSDKVVVRLARLVDCFHFYVGLPINLAFDQASGLRPESRRHRFWRRLTAPFRRRFKITAIDYGRGTVTAAADPKWWRFL